jgi:hypothetical protein
MSPTEGLLPAGAPAVDRFLGRWVIFSVAD